ncbi:MAG: PilZ domain-containing protein [Pseudomonadota bacterium]
MSAGDIESDNGESVSPPRRRARQDGQPQSRPIAQESRSFPRVRVPMIVEARHPSFGTREGLIENISEGGLLLRLSAPDLTPGAQLKLQLLNTSAVDHEPTPTVSMQVARVEAESLGLTFASASARHLWHTAERRRQELTVGTDYFQVQVNLLIMAGKRLLLLARQGRWFLPGFFLQVGDDIPAATMAMLASFELSSPKLGSVQAARTQALDRVPETAALCLYQQVMVDDTAISLSQQDDYSDHRWVQQARKLKELTVASAATTQVIESVLQDHS